AVGAGVSGLQVGDEVIAIASWSIGTSTVAPAELVTPKPARLSFVEAATLPVAFMTASYALEQLGRVQPGERMLIHTASGGPGLAALQIARRAGAEILATAGSPAKRDFLRGLGVQHVMDSRSLAFADEILALTGNGGVDVVLNSLTGEAMARSLALLAPY